MILSCVESLINRLNPHYLHEHAQKLGMTVMDQCEFNGGLHGWAFDRARSVLDGAMCFISSALDLVVVDFCRVRDFVGCFTLIYSHLSPSTVL